MTNLITPVLYIESSYSGKIREATPIIDNDGKEWGTIDCPVFPATILLDDIEGWSVKMILTDNGYWYKVKGYPPSHHME
jgi:hypothetical protein